MDFRAFQNAFAARLRDPRGAARPGGVPARRMRVYEELLYNNIDGFLSACFPITREILGARAWPKTVKAFFAAARMHSPLFRDIPKAFLDWMENESSVRFPKKPWLCEFMHYEWLELAVMVHPDGPDPAGIDTRGDLMTARPALNPATRLGCYHYPVERIGARSRPKADGQLHCFLVFRDADDATRFIKVNPLTARLFEILQAEPLSGAEALERLALEVGHADPESLKQGGQAILQGLHAEGVILGTRR
jgi:uncharacterized protein